MSSRTFASSTPFMMKLLNAAFILLKLLLVPDSNEFIFGLGGCPKAPCPKLLKLPDKRSLHFPVGRPTIANHFIFRNCHFH